MSWWSDITAGAVMITLSNLAVLATAVIALVRTTRGIKEVHTLVNSQLSEFKALIEKSARAEGVLEGHAASVAAEPTQVEVVKAIPIEIKNP